jgi:hypothetical protein
MWNNADEYFGDVPELNDILFGDSSIMDQHAQDLMWSAYVDGNDAAYQELVDYVWDNYGIDFEAEWDWEDFAEWYESQ